MRITFLIIMKAVGILNDKFSLPQCSSSSSQSAAYQVELGRGSGSLLDHAFKLFMMNSCGMREFVHSAVHRGRDARSALGSF